MTRTITSSESSPKGTYSDVSFMDIAIMGRESVADAETTVGVLEVLTSKLFMV